MTASCFCKNWLKSSVSSQINGTAYPSVTAQMIQQQCAGEAPSYLDEDAVMHTTGSMYLGEHDFRSHRVSIVCTLEILADFRHDDLYEAGADTVHIAFFAHKGIFSLIPLHLTRLSLLCRLSFSLWFSTLKCRERPKTNSIALSAPTAFLILQTNLRYRTSLR